MNSFKFISDSPTSLRLDLFLVAQNISPSRSQLAKWIKEGGVTVNGEIAKAATLVELNSVVEVNPPEIKPSVLVAENIPLNILYEDDDLIVLNKSPEVVVHPGAGQAEGTLVNALLHHCKGLSIIGGVERPGIVHRLDKGTSGVMVVAKNDKTHVYLAKQFTQHEIKKTYWAIVFGAPKPSEGTYHSELGRSRENRQKFTVVQFGGKEAITHYKTLIEKGGISLLEVNIETGRTHQIRVHLTHAGHGIVGDPLYGGSDKRIKNLSNVGVRKLLSPITHTLLHSREISFSHPNKKKKMSFTAPLPADYQTVFDYLNVLSFRT